MQKFVMFSIVGFVALALAAPHGAALHCNGEITDLGGIGYNDQRGDYPEGWTYLETNGQAGLQSGGEQVAGLHSDACNHPNPDLLVY